MYRLDATQQGLVDRARGVAEQVLGPAAADVDADGRFPKDGMEALGRAGVLGFPVPKANGGQGAPLRVLCAVLDEVAQRCGSTAMVLEMHFCAIANYAAAPTPPTDVLAAAAKGEHLATLAWSEKGSRSHFWAPTSQAVAGKNGGVEASADKSWVTSAGHADSFSVSTRRAGGEAPTDTMLYLVRARDAGVSVSGPWNGMGLRGNASAPMRLERVALAKDRALCADGKGFETMLGVVLPVFALGSAAVSCGLAEAAVAATVQHLTSTRFEHMGSRLCDLPTQRARVARMRIETDRARAHLVATLDAVERGDGAAQLYVLEAKAQAAEAAMKVTDDAMRACGGAAFSRHLGVERLFRDARASAVMAPTGDVLEEFIGRAICGLDLFS